LEITTKGLSPTERKGSKKQICKDGTKYVTKYIYRNETKFNMADI